MRVAIQGEEGSFSHEAARQFFPSGLVLSPRSLSRQVFDSLSRGEVDAAVIPIENSLAGSVLEHYDLLLDHPVRIEAERMLRIEHQLIAAPGADLSSIHEVYSHPVALAQCRNLFASHPGLVPVPFYDTAGSVTHALRSGGTAAAIASLAAAELHGGQVLLGKVQDHGENYTRFFLIRAALPANQQLPRNSYPANKVSIAFAVPDAPGSLVRALEVFAHCGLNLTRIESRPVPGSPWEYIFYADYQLSDEARAEQALGELAAQCTLVKELGRYHAAEDSR